MVRVWREGGRCRCVVGELMEEGKDGGVIVSSGANSLSVDMQYSPRP